MSDYNTQVKVLMNEFGKFLNSDEFKKTIQSGKPVASGSFSFKTLPDENKLQLLITFAHIGSPGEVTGKVQEDLMKIYQAIQDPKIGGMFDHFGCEIVFDESDKSFKLIWSCNVNEITPETFTNNLKHLFQISAAWQARWLPQILSIVQDGLQPPIKPITLATENLFKPSS